ncbi:MAG: HAMP domain-containing protein [Rhodocyclales bacterium GT-UBC]|nr:MAG: HAMP domain-containing protein [Rhodocyclales bacterium GT-UBC]
MLVAPAKLSRKIVGILFGFFLIALSAIVLTLLISWQLEGVAAAINDAGSQRMRTYRISHLMARAAQVPESGERIKGLRAEMLLFDKVLTDLRQGDPARPMAPPRNDQVDMQLRAVESAWQERLRPLVENYLNSPAADRLQHLNRFDQELEGFVSRINDLVLAMEHSYADDTNLLRSVQVALVVFSIIGTAILIRFFGKLVIQPIVTLHASMRRMMDNDLSVRLPVTSDDEVGGLAQGFNQMAEHLQTVYSTLEERVAGETRNLAERNHELGILYLTTAYLSEPAPIEVLCRGFLDRIKEALGADAAAVRLYSEQTGLLHLVTHDGLSDDFVANESDLNCGECLCGQVIQTGVRASFATENPPPGMKLRSCIREGFATATAFTIMHDKNRLGVYNLYFRRPQGLSKREEHLLETLGQHLGVAIENLRLKSREKELAISEERNLLAQELHDSIAQGLAFMNIQVQLLEDSLSQGDVGEALQTAGMLREGIQESYDDVRELLVHFRTRLHQADLDSAIRAALEKFEGQTGIVTAFETLGSDGPLVPTDETQIMHIVQESLSNIRKHAGARHVRVLLKRHGGQLVVEILDDGRGFDPVNEPNVQSDGHVGLKIMRERAYRVGGECKVESEIGGGTRVTLTMPREQERSN